MRTVSILIVASALAAGCSRTPEPQTNPFAAELVGAPKWVLGDCRTAFDDDEVICGVGSVDGTANLGLARSSATARARTDIARQLQVKVQAMLKDYQATVTGGEEFGKAASDEQLIQDVSRQITDQSLSGTRLVDSWISGGGTYYALVSLDVPAFLDALSGMGALDVEVRRAVESRAAQAFAELDQATGR